MKKVTIKVKGTTHDLKFGYASMRKLGDLLAIDTYDGTAQKIATVIESLAAQEKKGGQLPFEVLDVLGQMVVSAVSSDDVDFNKDDVVDVIFEDMAIIKPIVEAWAASMPKPKPEPAPQKKRKAQTQTR